MYKKRLIIFLAVLGVIGSVAFFALKNNEGRDIRESVRVTTAIETPVTSQQTEQNVSTQKEIASTHQSPTPQEQKDTTAPNAQTVTLRVGATSYETPWRDGITAIDAMDALKSAGKISFSAKEFSGLGMFVEEIAGKKNGDGFYWILYMNGEKSAKGASQTILAPGDRIEWKYEKGY